MFRCFLLLLIAAFVGRKTAWSQNKSWTAPFPSHKIAGNLYYVGTEDLACFLITTSKGHILINSGLADSVPLIRDGVVKSGYKMEDIKILLTMQAHYDHVAGFAEIRKLTGAKVYATAEDAPVLEDGGKSDPVLGEKYRFTPVKVDRRLKHGDLVTLGPVQLRVHLTPGHTKGSVSYSMKVTESGRTYDVLIANMGSVVMPLVENPKYPDIAEDFARSFRVQKALTADIWVAAHASHYGMHQKYKDRSFVDPEGYKQAVERFEALYLKQLASERR